MDCTYSTYSLSSYFIQLFSIALIIILHISNLNYIVIKKNVLKTNSHSWFCWASLQLASLSSLHKSHITWTQHWQVINVIQLNLNYHHTHMSLFIIGGPSQCSTLTSDMLLRKATRGWMHQDHNVMLINSVWCLLWLATFDLVFWPPPCVCVCRGLVG